MFGIGFFINLETAKLDVFYTSVLKAFDDAAVSLTITIALLL